MRIFFYYLVAVNIVAFFLYGLDKWKAAHHQWRISEAALMTAAVIGGSIGALGGMYLFRHKTRHRKFTWGVPAILLVQAALVWVYLIR